MPQNIKMYQNTQLLSRHQNQYCQYKNTIFNKNQQYFSAVDIQSMLKR